MEYSFTRNDFDDPVAKLNMEAEAFGHWLNIEMSRANDVELQKIAASVAELLKGLGWQHEFAGREFHLEIDRQQVTVSANALLEQRITENPEFDEEFSDDEEDELSDGAAGLVASCGLEDFQILLLAWIEYRNNAI